MKKKIFDALKTEYASLGLSDNSLNRIAAFLEGSVEKEEDIATAVKRDDVKLIAKSIQGEIDGIQKAKKAAEDALADYKAKHPEEVKPKEEEEHEQKLDWQATLAETVKNAIAPLAEEIAILKSSSSAKEALTSAREKLFGGYYA